MSRQSNYVTRPSRQNVLRLRLGWLAGWLAHWALLALCCRDDRKLRCCQMCVVIITLNPLIV